MSKHGAFSKDLSQTGNVTLNEGASVIQIFTEWFYSVVRDKAFHSVNHVLVQPQTNIQLSVCCVHSYI